MSSRGRGGTSRHQGRRSGRGGNQGRSTQSSQTKSDTRKKVEDIIFSVGSSRQASDFISANEFLINHVKKTYEFGINIAASLEKEEDVDWTPIKPTLAATTGNTAEEKAASEEENKVLMIQESKLFADRKMKYEANKGAAHALYWE